MNYKAMSFTLILVPFLFVGCSNKRPLSTVEATDYAMSCEALISEIKDIRGQLATEEDANLAKNVVGKIATFGIYSADEEKEIMLRERAKALQLIYTIKQAKNECKALSQDDLKVDSLPARQVKQAKTAVNDTTKAIQE